MPEPYAAPVVMSLVLEAFLRPYRRMPCQFSGAVVCIVVCTKCQKRRTIWQRDLIMIVIMANETYEYTDIPEVCVRVKTALYMWQKSPLNNSIPDPCQTKVVPCA